MDLNLDFAGVGSNENIRRIERANKAAFDVRPSI